MPFGKGEPDGVSDGCHLAAFRDLINEPKGAPRESYYLGGPVPLSAANLGDPGAMIARIVKECGGK